ncbi:hypothetical protein CEE37_14555 [candidate division LCP-89 bacterium B3_LCP]|uniref:AtpZ/AtpI family protein n=1 Tax=candidate division LCP-89 bacterium B3_LCP TaxID=2012998 RepID=A0A532UPT5_UNCL8|nr:MAG: hypothetical protein CEE37_14555 [candidate division LCP-89 bacterium B3_LCP]
MGFGRLPQSFDLALRWALTLAVSVLVGLFIGRWVDSKLGSSPLFLLIGVFWGLGGSFYSLFLQLKKIQEDEESESGSEKKENTL